MDGIRRLSRWTSVLIAVAVAGAMLATPAVASARSTIAPPSGQPLWQPLWQPRAEQSALEDPPDVRGLSVDDARKALQAWNPNVVIQRVPERLPSGVDESTVVVATSTLVNQPSSPNVTVIRPVVRLTLGTRVPDLTGMTSAAAAQALAARGLRLGRPSPQPDPTWVVTTQQVPPGSIVEFGLTVAATFGAPETGPPTLVLIGAAGLALLLLALATTLGIRASRRRARRRRDRLAAAVRVETHPGQVIGPDLTEHTGTVSVRLAPHHDPGTVNMEEVRQ
jgi:PASTA domain